MVGFDFLKATEPSKGLPVTHLINLEEMKGCISLRATQQFWAQDSCIGNSVPGELSIEGGWNLLHPINTKR